MAARRMLVDQARAATLASFGPSRSPMCMYIWRMRSEVVTDAWRSTTSMRPTNSSSSSCSLGAVGVVLGEHQHVGLRPP